MDNRQFASLILSFTKLTQCVARRSMFFFSRSSSLRRQISTHCDRSLLRSLIRLSTDEHKASVRFAAVSYPFLYMIVCCEHVHVAVRIEGKAKYTESLGAVTRTLGYRHSYDRAGTGVQRIGREQQ